VVIGDDFAWAHLPKAGGDATQAMFESVPGLVAFADPTDSNDKHLAFSNRRELVSGKLLVMNIRRLPAWILSASHHKARAGIHPEFRPLPMASAEEMAENTEGSGALWWMTEGGQIGIDRWLRTEHLQEDVLSLLEDVGAVGPGVARLVGAVGRRNAANYDHDLATWFSAAQIRQMYERNPLWAGIERSAFGNLLCD
jgi:hypothetical protein